jgi:diguanylate cyclase (GGDEF)-like protein
MQLIKRSDVTLLVGFVIAAVVTFQGPIHRFLQIGREIEEQHGLALVPGLSILIIVLLGNHLMVRLRRTANRRRQVAASDVLALSQELALATNREAIRDVLRQKLPSVVGNDDSWVVIRESGQWQLVAGGTSGPPRVPPGIEALATEVAHGDVPPTGNLAGVRVDGHLCFLVPVGEDLAVFGIPLDSGGEHEDRMTQLAIAASSIGMALRNAQLLVGMEELGVTDGLTGCVNRSHGMKLLDTELKRAKRARSTLSVAMLDLDYFKSVNDEYGHLCGDALLMAIGKKLHEMLRNSDIKCRYGGEEFLLLLPDTPLAGAVHVANMLREEIETVSVESRGQVVSRTASVGIAVAGPGELDPKALVGRADDALYRAKHGGRGRVCVDGMDEVDPVVSPVGGDEDAALVATKPGKRQRSVTTTTS